jgi:hypothetical protein
VSRRFARTLVAGAATALGTVLYAVNFHGIVPDWWLALALGGAGAAALPLAVSTATYVRGAGLAVSRGTPRGLAADLGPLAQPTLIGATAISAMLVATSFAERSVVEGAIRAAFEGVAFAASFLALRRFLVLER